MPTWIEVILWIGGGFFSLFLLSLSVIAYFMKQIHADFKDFKLIMNQHVQTLTENQIRNEEKGRSGYRELSRRLDNVEEDVKALDKKIDDHLIN